MNFYGLILTLELECRYSILRKNNFNSDCEFIKIYDTREEFCKH